MGVNEYTDDKTKVTYDMALQFPTKNIILPNAAFLKNIQELVTSKE